ncbi:MAG: hypothetical protein HOP15_04815 [Planctomycetes bacterium]|nr:hypothetical protein [Planctomycetota bacterium]
MGSSPPRRLPPRGFLGLALIALAWPANWLLPGLRTHLLFLPLWLGYVLFLDGWIERRDGSSPCTRARRGFVGLFLISVPLWWLFEAANRRLGNWEYLGRERFGEVEYTLLCSLAFSTVVPAVLVSAEWARGFGWVERLGRGPRLAPSSARSRAGSARSGGGRALCVGLFAAGLALLAGCLRWPLSCYPLLWVAGVFLLEPLLLARGRRSLLFHVTRGDWRPWIALWTGGLVCGFFWELWNVHSYPKWIYHIPASSIPGVNGPKLFEMPLLGYLGYWPFALVVYQWKELWLSEPELLVNGSGGCDQRQAPEIHA